MVDISNCFIRHNLGGTHLFAYSTEPVPHLRKVAISLTYMDLGFDKFQRVCVFLWQTSLRIKKLPPDLENEGFTVDVHLVLCLRFYYENSASFIFQFTLLPPCVSFQSSCLGTHCQEAPASSRCFEAQWFWLPKIASSKKCKLLLYRYEGCRKFNQYIFLERMIIWSDHWGVFKRWGESGGMGFSIQGFLIRM